ncbi:DUF2249 domain-containing protein [Gelidibacter salicanalis]|uniref:DUF2249 domain-containing protein n=1 Tax=Gelidibacter salicanalis TaxID=291193 RepID=A0A934KYZ9_9FLAO|nr:DUF2249 domain-containing protein [Gelidibacter salicanalis]MBJ7881965.1 DUF2249 domain-containing protein [Gelidibacter salicanalis]
MKPINANTKIAHLLKAHPDAMEAIISIDQKFDKLRNPLLRKLLAGRTSIAMASKMAGCQVDDFFSKLKPLGFEIDTETVAVVEDKKELPAFITTLTKNQIIDFDVRELLASGKDPLTLILDKMKSIQAGEALKVINTFEPVPLIKMLEKQGFDVYADIISNELVETYFYKRSDNTPVEVKPKDGADSGWDSVMQRFIDKLVTVDVRELEMPQPMLTILAELDKLPVDEALYVYHKRIPVFLLPELSDRKFDYRIKEISEGEVRLLIFKS